MGAVRKLAADPESKDKNRIGVLLGTKQTRETKTLTHVMWALFNLLPARTTQKPHRHTPTALDFAVSAPAKGASLPLCLCVKSVQYLGKLHQCIDCQVWWSYACWLCLYIWYISFVVWGHKHYCCFFPLVCSLSQSMDKKPSCIMHTATLPDSIILPKPPPAFPV